MSLLEQSAPTKLSISKKEKSVSAEMAREEVKDWMG